MQQEASEQPRPQGPDERSPGAPSGNDAGPGRDAPRPAPRRWLRRFLLLLGPPAVAIVGGYFYVPGGRYVSTETAHFQAEDRESVVQGKSVSGSGAPRCGRL